MTKKEKALRKYLELDPAQKIEIENDYYRIVGTGEEYLVGTDEEASQWADDYIRDSLWAFDPSFLLTFLPEGMTEEALEKIQELCEDANPSLLSMVGDQLDQLINDAIASDGRGHFISSYDGEENYQEVDGEEFYIYRTN